ncbi:MAG: ArnT family glycosyltransferase [Flavobacteriales bacterium]
MKNIIGFENRDRAFRWFALMAIIVAGIFLVRFRFKGQEWNRTITSDGSGYYAYLPAFLLFHDPQYRFYLELKNTYGISDLSENFLYTHEGRYFNRYFAGTSVAMAPFFGCACLVQAIIGGPLDGHHPVFVFAVHLAGLFYALAGLYALYVLLLRRASPGIACLLVIILFFGTNLWNYAVNQPAYSHVYSFAFISFFLLALQRFIERESSARLAMLAACLGMIVLIRPSNVLVIGVVPVFFPSLQAFGSWMRRLVVSSRFYLMCIVFLAFPAFQSWLYYLQCGAFWVDGYPYEHFNLLHPHLWEIWLHPRAGMLLYSPVLIFIFIGWFRWYSSHRYPAITWLAFTLAATWVISSWWAWHYAGTIGMRAMTDHLSWLILPVAAIPRSNPSQWKKIALACIALLLCMQGMLVNYQAFTGILPHDHMTGAKYTYLLGETRLSRTGFLDDRWYPNVPNTAIHTDAFTWSAQETLHERPFAISSDGCIDTVKWKAPLERRVYIQFTGKVRFAKLSNESCGELRFYSNGLEVQRHQIRFTEPSFEPAVWTKFNMCKLQDFGDFPVDEVRIYAHLDQRSSAEISQCKLIMVGYK